MNRIVSFSLVVASLCLSACRSGVSPSATVNAAKPAPVQTAQPCRIAIKYRAAYRPEDVEVLGTIKPNNPRLATTGDEAHVLGRLCAEACRLGADLVNITEERSQTAGTNYRASAEFIRYKDRVMARRLYSDVSYTQQFVTMRHESIEREKNEVVKGFTGAIIGGAIAGPAGGAIGAAIATGQ